MSRITYDRRRESKTQNQFRWKRNSAKTTWVGVRSTDWMFFTVGITFVNPVRKILSELECSAFLSVGVLEMPPVYEEVAVEGEVKGRKDGWEDGWTEVRRGHGARAGFEPARKSINERPKQQNNVHGRVVRACLGVWCGESRAEQCVRACVRACVCVHATICGQTRQARKESTDHL